MTAVGWLLLILALAALVLSLVFNWWQAQQLDEVHGSHARPRADAAPARPARSLITPVLATAHAQAMHEASTPHLPAGRHAAGLPRRDSGATLHRAPWETGSFPVPVDVTMTPVYGQASQDVVERMEGGLLT